MGGGDGPDKLYRVVTVEAFKEKKGIIAISPQQEDINKPEPRLGLESSEFRKFSKDPMNTLAKEGPPPSSLLSVPSPGGSYSKLSHDTIFIVCSHTFILF
jgi:hypothetical protein